MHGTLERPTETATGNGSGRAGVVEELPVLPNYGRTVQVVGPVINVNTEQMPHPKNIRGELGKAAFNWYRNTVSKDPAPLKQHTERFVKRANV